MKSIIIGTYFHLLTFLRVKKALFFAFFFPSFIYVLFSQIWGVGNEDYQIFLLTGVIVMATVSDALFSTGNLIANYYQSGFIRFFMVIPNSFVKHISTLIISRIIIVLLSSIIIFVVAYLISCLKFSLSDILFVLSGISAGLLIFTLIGLIIAEIVKDPLANTGISNFIFFGILFLSNTLYPLTELNPALKKVVLFNPMTPVLELTRGALHIVPLVIWIVALVMIQSIIFVKNRLKR